MTVQDNILYFAGCNTQELAKTYGTPLILISEDAIAKKTDEIHRDFTDKYDHVRAVYASKAFLNSAMCKIIERAGLGLDVVSGGELYVAQHAGFPMDQIIFHGNNKSVSELKEAIENGVGRIVVDNFSELELVCALSKQMDTPANLLFRITPGIKSDTHAYISTADKDSKFGFPLHSVPSAFEFAKKHENITVMGLHFHVGSQLQSPQSHLDALDVILKLMSQLIESGYPIYELNTGGGYGVKYTDIDEEMQLATFTAPIMERIEAWSMDTGHKRPLVIIEPGRWLIANAGLTLYTVGSSKSIPQVRDYIAVDGGIPDNIRPALYTAKYRAVIANKMNCPAEKTVTIAGKCCESGDILIRDITLPEAERGDLLAVFGTGAYTESMSSNYNLLPRPAVVLVGDKGAFLIKRRESYEDLIRRDVLPSHLI